MVLLLILIESVVSNDELQILDTSEFDALVTGASSLVMSTDPKDDKNPPVPASYTLTTTDIKKVDTIYYLPTIEPHKFPGGQDGTKYTYPVPLRVTSLTCIPASQAPDGDLYGRVAGLFFEDGNKITTDNIGTSYTIIGDPYSTGLTWAKTLSTSDMIHQGAQNKNGLSYRIEFDEPVEISIIYMFGDYLNGSGSGHHPKNLSINDEGNALEPPGDIILTFPGDVSTNPDLKYFKVGDVVQGPTVSPDTVFKGYYSLTTLGTNATLSDVIYLQDIQIGNRPTKGGAVKTILYEFPSPQANLPFVRYEGEATNASNAWSMYGSNTADGTDWVEIHKDVATYYGPGDTRGSSGNTPYKYLLIPNKGGTGSGISFPKYGIDDTLLAQQVKVVSTDLVNNKMTVDGGDWDSFGNEIWSDRLTTTYNSGNMLIASDKAFNGTFADYAHGGVGTGVVMTFDGTGITVNKSLRVNIVTGNEPNPPTVSANGGTEYTYPQKDGASVGANSGEWVNLNFTGDLSKIEFKTQGNTNGLYLYGIEVDGTLLIDSTGGDTQVTFGPVTGTADYVSSTSGNNLILEGSEGRWIGENYGEGSGVSIPFYVAAEDQYTPSTRFFDTNIHNTITVEDINSRYGADPVKFDLKKLGIFELTEQPRTFVLGYKRNGDKYEPVYNLVPAVNSIKSRLGI